MDTFTETSSTTLFTYSSNDTSSLDHETSKHIGSEFTAGQLTHKTIFTISLIILYAMAFIMGLVGNSLVIAVVVQNHHMRTVTNMFLVNLCIGDILVAVVCMPFSLAPYVYKVSICIYNSDYCHCDDLSFLM